MEGSSVIMLQILEVDKETPAQLVHDLMTSKAEMAKNVPAGLLFSCGGFKVEAEKPTFELLTAWKDEKSEEDFRHTPFYTQHLEMFQKYSSKPIDTKVIKSAVEPVKPQEKKCLEVYVAHVDGEAQKQFVESLKKLREKMNNLPGLLSSFGGVTKDEVYTFITWETIEDHKNFQKSAEFPDMLAECMKIAPKCGVYHLQL